MSLYLLKSHCRQVCIGFHELILRILNVLKISQFYFSILSIACGNKSNSIFPREYRLPYNDFQPQENQRGPTNQGLFASCSLKLHKAVQVNAWLHTNNDARCARYGTHTYTPGLTEPRGHASPLYQLRGADYAQQITRCSPPFNIFRPS